MTTVEVSDRMQPGHVSPPNGMGVGYPTGNGPTVPEDVTGVPLNTLTRAADRDRFFGNPGHKAVPARLEPLRTPGLRPAGQRRRSTASSSSSVSRLCPASSSSRCGSAATMPPCTGR